MRYKPQEQEDIPERIFSSHEVKHPGRMGRMSVIMSVLAILGMWIVTPYLLVSQGKMEWGAFILASLLIVSSGVIALSGGFGVKQIRRESKGRHHLNGSMATCVLGGILSVIGGYAAAIIAVLAAFGVIAAIVVAIILLIGSVIVLTNVDY